jgi:hypothetical protein
MEGMKENQERLLEIQKKHSKKVKRVDGKIITFEDGSTEKMKDELQLNK